MIAQTPENYHLYDPAQEFSRHQVPDGKTVARGMERPLGPSGKNLNP
jgi:hypothetical protein